MRKLADLVRDQTRYADEDVVDLSGGTNLNFLERQLQKERQEALDRTTSRLISLGVPVGLAAALGIRYRNELAPVIKAHPIVAALGGLAAAGGIGAGAHFLTRGPRETAREADDTLDLVRYLKRRRAEAEAQ